MIELNRELAREALNEKISFGNENFKRDFEDSENWELLAKERGIKLPQWWQAPEVPKMRRWLRRLRVKEREYREACGEGWQLEDFGKLNPTFPLRVFVGNLLEYVDELDNAKEVLQRYTNKN